MQLFGGQRSVALGYDMDEHSTLEDYKRVAELCRVTPKGSTCKISGPGLFFVQYKEPPVKIAVEPSDQGEVRLIGTKIECEDK